MSEVNEMIGKRINRLRWDRTDENGKPLSPESLSKILLNNYGISVSASAIRNYENGVRDIPSSFLYALAVFYGVKTDYFFGFVGNTAPTNYSSFDTHRKAGLSSESLNILFDDPDLSFLIDQLIKSNRISKIVDMTLKSRYTIFEHFDNGFRSYLTSRLLYSMIQAILDRNYYEKYLNPLSDTELQDISEKITLALKEKRNSWNKYNEWLSDPIPEDILARINDEFDDKLVSDSLPLEYVEYLSADYDQYDNAEENLNILLKDIEKTLIRKSERRKKGRD